METSARAQFHEDFYKAIRRDKEGLRRDCVNKNEASTFNRLSYTKLAKSIAYIFLMTDDELFNKINECVSNGFATKAEICRLFKVREHIMSDRIAQALSESLRIYYNQLIDNVAETYSLANPSFFNATEINKDGDIVDCGYVSAIKKFASRGFGKKEICEMMEFNPASWNEYPVLEQAYNVGQVEFQSGKADAILTAISNKFIRNNYFIDVVIPAIQLEAFEHKVLLTKKKYAMVENKETGEKIRILKFEETEEKLVAGNKDMRDYAIRLSAGKLLEENQLDRDTHAKVKAIPMFRSELVTDKGTFEIPTEDADYEPAED